MITNVNQWQRPKQQGIEDIAKKVDEMLTLIENQGDEAIEQYAEQFDNCKPQIIELKPFADYQLNEALANAIQLAAKRIEIFCKFQKQSIQSQLFTDDYGTFGQVINPIERVAAYIPGGRFPLISTSLMTLIPARIAGSKVRIACSPSTNPALLAAASLAGATQFMQLGGVQAIAAMTFGYQQIVPVDLMVGPGNAWVNEAKKQIQNRIKIDGLAGPSELLAICDAAQPVEWLAYDALAQAEHDPLACSIIISDDLRWLEKMHCCLQQKPEFCEILDSKQVELIYAANKEQLLHFSETFGPEHLMLCHEKISAQELTNFGSLFIGANSAVALGDYISGPNHTLPTLGYSRQTGGLSVNTFLRIQTIQKINVKGRQQLSKAAMPLAEAEGLVNHYESMKIRL